MKTIIIAAVSDNLVIGKKNDLLWHMPADLRFFRKNIQNKWILVGRKSYESAQGEQSYSGRDTVIVVTRNKDYSLKHGIVVHSVEVGLQLSEKLEISELCILGGAEIYNQTIDKADELIITEIHYEFDGDAVFPPIDLKVWEEYFRENYMSDSENPFNYSFVKYKRRPS